MNDFINTLAHIYSQRKHIIKRLQKLPANSSHSEFLEKLSGFNHQILNLISREKFDLLLKSGIKDDASQKYLTTLVWDQVNIKSATIHAGNGIIPLLIHQNELIGELLPKFNELNGINSIESKFKILLNLIRREWQLFKCFQRDFQALYQEKLSLQVIGFGEISTVFGFSGGKTYCVDTQERNNWVYKKMPIFPDMEQAQKFIVLFQDYRRLFVEEIGIKVPEQRVQIHPVSTGKIRLYALQRKLNIQAVGNKLIQLFSEEQCVTLLKMILAELKKVWIYNRSQEKIKVAIDGQISNWILADFDPTKDRFTGNEKLIYIDTSSPLYRIDGREQLDAELFLKSTPFFLRPIIRALFLQQVLDRYYDLHLVTVDLIANFFKEGRAVFIPKMIETANNFFTAQMSDFDLQPITQEEVTKYYKNDAFIWRFYLAARKIDRFITEKLLHKRYEFRLPEKVQR